MFQDTRPHKLLRQIMSLPFLPSEHIAAVLEHLDNRACDEVKAITGYIQETWIDGYWCAEDWSVYKRQIRTNNDLEGYHNRLNRQGKHNMLFYELIDLLHKESKFVTVTTRLISEKKLTKRERTAHRKKQEKVNYLWEKYDDGDHTTKEAVRFLKAISGIHGPCI